MLYTILAKDILFIHHWDILICIINNKLYLKWTIYIITILSFSFLQINIINPYKYFQVIYNLLNLQIFYSLYYKHKQLYKNNLKNHIFKSMKYFSKITYIPPSFLKLKSLQKPANDNLFLKCNETKWNNSTHYKSFT